MATVRWNFPNGTNAEPLTAALAGASNSDFTGGNASISTDRSVSGAGGRSARFLLQASGALMVSREGISASSYAYDVYLNVSTRLGGNIYVGWAGATSSTRSTGIRFGGSLNNIALQDTTATAVWTGTAGMIPDNTWVRMSVFATCESFDGAADGTARLAWYLGSDTVPQEDSGLITGLSTRASIDRIRIGGKAASSSVATGEVYVGSWAYDTTATSLIPPIGAEAPVAAWQRRQAGAWVSANVQVRASGAWQLKDPSRK